MLGRERWPAVIVAVASATAATLFFTGLDRQSLWLDELFTVTTSRGSLADLNAFWQWDRHPPWYGLLLHGWIRVFGDGEAAVRSLSALACTLVVPSTYWLGRRVMPDRIAATAAILAMGSTTLLYFAQEARVYGLLILAANLATYTWLIALRDVRQAGRIRRPLAFALTGMLAASLHYYGAALVGFQVAYLALVLVRRGGWRDFPLGISVIALGPATAELLLHLQYLRSDLGQNWIRVPDLALARGVLRQVLGMQAWAAGAIVVAVLGSVITVGVGRTSRHARETLRLTEPAQRALLMDAAYLVVVPLVFLAASSFVVPTLISRNTVVFVPAVLILVAWWLALAKPLVGVRLPLFAATVVLASTASYMPWYASPHKQQWREAAMEVVERATDRTLVATISWPDRQPLLESTSERSLWWYYLEAYGASSERRPFDRMRSVANSPEAMARLLEVASAEERSRLLLFAAHVPPLTEDALGVLRAAAVSVDEVRFLRANVYEVVLR